MHCVQYKDGKFYNFLDDKYHAICNNYHRLHAKKDSSAPATLTMYVPSSPSLYSAQYVLHAQALGDIPLVPSIGHYHRAYQ